MIENRNPGHAVQPILQFAGDIQTVKTKKDQWGTTIFYGVMFRTTDPRILVLGAIKASQRIKITVEPIGESEEANQEREFK